MNNFIFGCLFASLVMSFTVSAEPTENNSNFWPVFRDDKTGFRISYPPTWIVVKPKGKNVKFSVNPPNGPGNCNVVARASTETSKMSQTLLNQEVDTLPLDRSSWAGYAGLPVSQVHVLSSKTTKIVDISAIMGIIEIKLENLQGKYMRKQKLALAFTPGVVWSLNCGATSFSDKEARSRFNTLTPSINKILGSFVFTYMY